MTLVLFILFLVISLTINKRLEMVRKSLVFIVCMSVNDAVALIKKARILAFMYVIYTAANILMFIVGVIFIISSFL